MHEPLKCVAKFTDFFGNGLINVNLIGSLFSKYKKSYILLLPIGLLGRNSKELI